MHIPSWYQSAYHPLSLGLNWVQCIMDNPLRWIKMLRREWKSDVLEMLLIKKCNFLCVWVCEREFGWKESCISKQQQMPLLSFKHSASLFCSKGTSRSRIHIIKPNKWLLYLAAGLSRQAQPIIETQSRAVMSFWKTLEGGKMSELFTLRRWKSFTNLVTVTLCLPALLDKRLNIQKLLYRILKTNQY